MKMQPKSRTVRPLALTLLLLLAVVMLLAACGGGGNDGTGDSAEVAQESSGSLSAAATMPVRRFVAPTAVIDLTKVAESESEATPDASGPDLAEGEGAYAKLCAECHGDAGEGVADKGESVVGTTLDDAALIDLLRTGGGNGSEHIFASIKISDDGIRSLLAYMQTLSE